MNSVGLHHFVGHNFGNCYVAYFEWFIFDPNYLLRIEFEMQMLVNIRLKILLVGDKTQPRRVILDLCISLKNHECRFCHLPGVGRVIHDNTATPTDVMNYAEECFHMARLHGMANVESERSHAKHKKLFGCQRPRSTVFGGTCLVPFGWTHWTCNLGCGWVEIP